MFCFKLSQIRFESKLWIQLERAAWAKYRTYRLKIHQNLSGGHFKQFILTLRWYCLSCGLHGNLSGAKWNLPRKWTFLLGNVSSHIFAYNQPRLSIIECISLCVAPTNISDNFVVLFYFSNLIVQKYFVAKKKGQNTSRRDGRQHVYPNYIQLW